MEELSKRVDGKMGYYPDNRSCMGNVEVDKLDVFYLRNYYKELGYDRMKEVWWLVPGKSIEEDLRKLNTDSDLERCVRWVHKTRVFLIYLLNMRFHHLNCYKGRRRYCLRSATGVGCTKGQKKPQGCKMPVMLLSYNEDSPNSDETSEDEYYKPVREDISSDSCVGDSIPSRKVKSRKKIINKSDEQGNGKGKSKDKEKICVDDDALVEDVLDVKVDLGFVGGGRTDNYDAYDPGTDFDLKTFRDDHTCAREDKNRADNRNWVASKLVRKVRKHPNFKHCDANTFFKTKYDFSLNRNSISRALSDARNLVYGDEKAQYAMVKDYGGYTFEN
ncbi:hypothetical protein Ahy_A09g043913 [Arachis hypogaea]|uniref:PB1-like domain-containing protein n=1 Tax=Arachis hypogaea TaxID=3818 RepID=A0A445BJA1_ARAHY|nr:hypothetical protein Ahy_A09g043913 [Arachis hypogaea]